MDIISELPIIFFLLPILSAGVGLFFVYTLRFGMWPWEWVWEMIN